MQDGQVAAVGGRDARLQQRFAIPGKQAQVAVAEGVAAVGLAQQVRQVDQVAAGAGLEIAHVDRGVRIGPADMPEKHVGVGAVAAGDMHVAGRTRAVEQGDAVVSCAAADARVRRAGGADLEVDGVVARAADVVGVVGAVQPVIAGAAVQGAAACRDIVEEIGGLQRIVAVAAEQEVGAGEIGQPVIAGAAVEEVVARATAEAVVMQAAEELVVAVATQQPVDAAAAVQRVVAGASIEDIVRFERRRLIAAVQQVVAAMAVEDIVAGAARQRIGQVAAVQGVGTVGPVQVEGHGAEAGLEIVGRRIRGEGIAGQVLDHARLQFHVVSRRIAQRLRQVQGQRVAGDADAWIGGAGAEHDLAVLLIGERQQSAAGLDVFAEGKDEVTIGRLAVFWESDKDRCGGIRQVRRTARHRSERGHG